MIIDVRKKCSRCKEDEAKGFVMSFSASLDLSFLIPVSKRNAVTNDDSQQGSDVFF